MLAKSVPAAEVGDQERGAFGDVQGVRFAACVIILAARSEKSIQPFVVAAIPTTGCSTRKAEARVEARAGGCSVLRGFAGS